MSDLIKRIEAMPDPSYDEEDKLLEQFLETRDIDIRNKLVDINLPNVLKIVKRVKALRYTRIPLEDLLSLGVCALIRSIESYDPEKSNGARLMTLACLAIYRDINNLLDKERVNRENTVSAGLMTQHERDVKRTDHGANAALIEESCVARRVFRLAKIHLPKEEFELLSRYHFTPDPPPSFKAVDEAMGLKPQTTARKYHAAVKHLREIVLQSGSQRTQGY